jgi:hypothetical protein
VTEACNEERRQDLIFLAELRQFFALGLRRSDRRTANNQFLEGPPDLQQLQLIWTPTLQTKVPRRARISTKPIGGDLRQAAAPTTPWAIVTLELLFWEEMEGRQKLSSIIIHIQLLISADHVFSISLTTGSGIGM